MILAASSGFEASLVSMRSFEILNRAACSGLSFIACKIDDVVSGCKAKST